MSEVIALTLFIFELQLDQSKALPDKITFYASHIVFDFVG